MATDPLFIRLYLDEDIFDDLATVIRQHGFDCISVSEAGRLGRTDEEQLEYAAGQGRCILSFNVKDFAVLAQLWAQGGRDHAGIAVTAQVDRQHFGQLLGRVLQFLNTTTADEMQNVFRYL